MSLLFAFFLGVVAYWVLLFKWRRDTWRNRRTAFVLILFYLILSALIILPDVKPEIDFLDNPGVQRVLFCYFGLLIGFFSHLPFTKKTE